MFLPEMENSRVKTLCVYLFYLEVEWNCTVPAPISSISQLSSSYHIPDSQIETIHNGVLFLFKRRIKLLSVFSSTKDWVLKQLLQLYC